MEYEALRICKEPSDGKGCARKQSEYNMQPSAQTSTLSSIGRFECRSTISGARYIIVLYRSIRSCSTNAALRLRFAGRTAVVADPKSQRTYVDQSARQSTFSNFKSRWQTGGWRECMWQTAVHTEANVERTSSCGKAARGSYSSSPEGPFLFE